MMMQYYVWSTYEAGSEFAFCESLEGLTEEQYDQLILGQKLDPVPDKLNIAKISDGQIGDSIGTIWGLHIVSDKIKQLLPEKEIQAIEVETNIELIEKYFLINIKERSNLDRGKSEVETSIFFPDEIEKVKKLVLKEFDNNSPVIYKLEEIPSCVIVAESLKNEIEKITNTGGEFIKVIEYTHGYF